MQCEVCGEELANLVGFQGRGGSSVVVPMCAKHAGEAPLVSQALRQGRLGKRASGWGQPLPSPVAVRALAAAGVLFAVLVAAALLGWIR